MEYYCRRLTETKVLLFFGIDFAFEVVELLQGSRNSYHFASFAKIEDITAVHLDCFALKLMCMYFIALYVADRHY